MASQVKEDLQGERWAEALQDGTLQGLAAVRMLLAAGMRRESPDALERAAVDAVGHLDEEIADLRGLLAEMRAS